MTYQEYVEALAFIEDLKKLALRGGVTPKELKEMWKPTSHHPSRIPHSVIAAALGSLRRPAQLFRTQQRWGARSSMQARVEKAKAAFTIHLCRVRPSVAGYVSSRSAPRGVSIHITTTPNAKDYVEVDVGPGHFLRFHISPAWALFPTWEKSFPNDVLIYRERVGASPHHWRVITGRFDPERYFVAKEQMLVIDPLTGALFLGLHLTAATRKMQQARSAAFMDAL